MSRREQELSQRKEEPVDPYLFRAGFEAGDAGMVIDTLAPEVVLHAPVLPAPFEGREAVGEVIEALVGIIEDLEYTDDIAAPDLHLLTFRAHVLGTAVEGVDLLRFDSEGRVSEIRVFARPLSGTAAMAAAMGPRLAQRRGRVAGALVGLASRPLPAMFAVFDAATSNLLARPPAPRAPRNRGRAVILYGLPGSHPTACVEAALRLKRVPCRRIDLPPIVTRPWLRRRFGEPTLPAATLDGERLSGSRRIVRRLDALHPDPPLFPAEPEARARVVEAERWGEEVFQSLVRRIALALARRDPDALTSFVKRGWPLVPCRLVRLTMPLLASALSRLHSADDSSAVADFAALRPALARIDGWVEDGTLGALQPNAADLQIGASLQLLETSGDLRALLAGRLCAGIGADFLPAAPIRTATGIARREWTEALEAGIAMDDSSAPRS